jgi:hypothetical protein
MDLRDEVVENQKARIDLFKWKIILIAGIGAASAGIGGFQAVRPALLFALIPWVCVYVDFLSRDQSLRIVTITEYLRLGGSLDGVKAISVFGGRILAHNYQAFVAKADRMTLVSAKAAVRRRFSTSRRSAYAFAFVAQDLSTGTVVFFIFCWGLILLRGVRWALLFGIQPNSTDGTALMLSAALGLIVTAASYIAYIRRWSTIETDFPLDP